MLPGFKITEFSIGRSILPNSPVVPLVVEQLTEEDAVQIIDKFPDIGHISYTIDGLSRVQMNDPSVIGKLNTGKIIYFITAK